MPGLVQGAGLVRGAWAGALVFVVAGNQKMTMPGLADQRATALLLVALVLLAAAAVSFGWPARFRRHHTADPG